MVFRAERAPSCRWFHSHSRHRFKQVEQPCGVPERVLSQFWDASAPLLLLFDFISLKHSVIDWRAAQSPHKLLFERTFWFFINRETSCFSQWGISRRKEKEKKKRTKFKQCVFTVILILRTCVNVFSTFGDCLVLGVDVKIAVAGKDWILLLWLRQISQACL